MSRFSWIQLADLGTVPDPSWPGLVDALSHDLASLQKHTGTFDLLVLTGRLTADASSNGYATLSRRLEQLLAVPAFAGRPPAVLVLPGSGDASPANNGDPIALVLAEWDERPALRDIWCWDPGKGYDVAIHRQFAAFAEWQSQWAATKDDGWQRQIGLVPGDTSLRRTIGGITIGLIALNTSYLDWTSPGHPGVVHPRQLHAVCDGDALAWLRGCNLAFLVTTHSPNALSKTARPAFLSEIAPPGRFCAHLWGPGQASGSESCNGAPLRHVLCVPDLLGADTSPGGYLVGVVTQTESLDLRVWPRILRQDALGLRFTADVDRWELEQDDGAPLLSPGFRRQSAPPVSHAYLRAIIESTASRQTLAGLRNFSITLGPLFVHRALTFAGEPSYARTDLLAWIRCQSEGEALLLLGEPGAGKTELVYHTAAELAAAAIESHSAPIPLAITAKDLVEGKTLEQAVRRRWPEGAEFAAAIARSSGSRYILMIDGLDEVHEQDVLELIRAQRTILGHRLAAVVVTSRPSFAPLLPRCRTAYLRLWTSEESAEFVVKWANHDPDGATRVRRELADPAVAEMFANPLTATLSIFTVALQPDALRSRASLYASVYDRVLQCWPSRRTPGRSSPWKSVAEVLQELAVECLREQRSSVPRKMLEARLRRHDDDDWTDTLDTIEVELGLLASSDDGRTFEFVDRRLMEYLAARELLRTPEKLVEHADLPWAHEPVRVALGLLASREPEHAQRLCCALLTEEADAIPGFHDTSLRKILVAIDIATDEPTLDVAMAPQLATAIFRRVTEEHSNWVGDEVVKQAKRLARRGGATFDELKPRLRGLLTEEALRRPVSADNVLPLLSSREAALLALAHRLPEVRLAACRCLKQYADDGTVQNHLFLMLFDQAHTWGTMIPFAAGAALRRASRGPGFAMLREVLNRVLAMRAQIPSCGAAIALYPDEAPVGALVEALDSGLSGSGGIPEEVFEALAAERNAAIEFQRVLGGWRERLDKQHFPSRPVPPLESLPPSDVCRARAFELLAASTDIEREIMDDALAVHENLHSYTESLLSLNEVDLYELLRHVREVKYTLCWVAQECLGQRAVNDQRLARYVLTWWNAVAHGPEYLRHGFPGRALEPLVMVGAPEAVTAYASWIQYSGLANRFISAHPVTLIPREVLTKPAIRDVIYEKYRHNGVIDPPRFARAWERDEQMWSRLDALLREEFHLWLEEADDLQRTQHWRYRRWITELRGIELPKSTRSLFLDIFDRTVRSTRHAEPGYDIVSWHNFVAHAIRFVSELNLVPEARGSLQYLAGDGTNASCRTLGLLAACHVTELLPANERVKLSSYWSKNFHSAAVHETLDPEKLRALVELRAEDWAEHLARLLEEVKTPAVYPNLAFAVYRALPIHMQRALAPRLLELVKLAPIPYIYRNFSEPRLYRLADEIRRVAFETRII